jgi:hypothetical protein
MIDRKLQQRAGAAKANQRQHDGFCRRKMSKALTRLVWCQQAQLGCSLFYFNDQYRQYRMKTSTRLAQPGLAWRNIWAKGAAI